MLKEDVTVLFLWRPLKSSVKEEIWRVVFDRELDTRVEVPVAPVVPDVTDVPVLPSSVVTEFCGGFSDCSDREFVEPQSFLFSKSVHIVVQ